ncbi:hypothetical protein V8D89_015838 [Ganoderma adspersum]
MALFAIHFHFCALLEHGSVAIRAPARLIGKTWALEKCTCVDRSVHRARVFFARGKGKREENEKGEDVSKMSGAICMGGWGLLRPELPPSCLAIVIPRSRSTSRVAPHGRHRRLHHACEALKQHCVGSSSVDAVAIACRAKVLHEEMELGLG